MALVLQDRVSVNSAGSGTGNLVLGSAYPGYRTFASCIPDGSIVYYTITNKAVGYDNEWEVGYGKYILSTDTLVRNNGNSAETGVYSSSNANAYVNFTAGINGLQVFITQPSEQAIYQEVNGDLKLVDGVISVSVDGTEGATLANTTYQAFGTKNNFIQMNQQNLSDGTNASTDYVATNDIGSDIDNYIDFGIGSSNYSSIDFPLHTAYSGYLYVQGDGTNVANLVIGTGAAGDVIIHAGGINTVDIVATANSTTKSIAFSNNVSVTSNVSANNVILTGAAFANAAVSAANQLATKQYVDESTSTGIHIHAPVLVETTGNLAATYAQGGTTFNITDIVGNNTVVTSTTHSLSVNNQIWLTSTAGNGLSANVAYFVYSTPNATSLTLSTSYGGVEYTGLTAASGLTYPVRANSGIGATLTNSGANVALAIDGVNLAITNRVMVRLQTDPKENGVYTVTTVGAPDSPGPGAAWVLTRATDADYFSPQDTFGLGEGDYFYTTSGLINSGDSHVLTTPGNIIIGYTPLTYTQFSGAVTYTGTAPINVSGQTIALTGTVGATNGGTGANTVTTGDILYGSGTNAWGKLPLGAAYKSLAVNASGTQVEWNAVALDQAAAISGSLGATNGGTGQSTYTLGDIIYSDATNSLAKLPGQTTTTQKFLSQTGTGTASGAPVWDTIPAGSVTGLGTMAAQNANAVTITGGTINDVVIGGSTANAGTFTTATATSFVGSGASLTNLNGSNVSSGTIDNARTTASTANGASTIVLRDAAGNFAANTITANLSGTASSATSATSATTATNIAGGLAGGIPYQTGASTTTILAAGTGVLVGGSTPSYSTTPTLTGTNFSGIPNGATTASAANGASTIVARDINGSFTANAVTTTSVSGDGSGLSGLNAANIASGTIGTARLASGTANSTTYLRGDSTWATVTSGLSVTDDTTTATGIYPTLSTATSGSISGVNVTSTKLNFVPSTGVLSSTGFSGSGASLTSLNASNLASGTIPSGILGNSSVFIGTTSVALNRSSASLSLTGVNIDGSAGSATSATTATTATTANALNTANNYQVNSLGVNTAGSGTAGEIRATNNITAFYSDERLKTKIGNIENALDKVCSIETMIYHANETAVALGYDASIVEVGVTAQSVQKVQPEVVVPAPIDKNYLTVRYEKLVPLLIEAIKELKAQVAELKYPKTGA